ncbi:MAG: uncharacterized protein A8A55_2018 [Amphiamblys sp. WSBS2006]|nr:MAG: uncharacterized protein A8A55_2018 [Amphiamblys sp. WSBS2006]
MDEYKKTIGKNAEGLSELITQYQTQYSFTLAQDLPNETLLLTDQTTVTLYNIEISEKLFFVLLEKTKIAIGEKFSITEHFDSEDCIGEHRMAKRSPFCLDKYGAVSTLALENIERMPPNSIGCSLKEVDLYSTGLINILAKLRISEDSKVERLRLSTNEKEHVAAILAQDKPFCVGSVEKIIFEDYAVSIIPKLKIHGDSEVETLKLDAREKEQVAEILSQDKPFCVRRVKNMELRDYAVSVLTKLGIHEGSEIKSLDFRANKEEHITEILSQDKPFCVRRVENMSLEDYAVSILPKLKIHEDSMVEKIKLIAREKEHVSVMFSQDKLFCIRRVESIYIENFT